MDDDEYYSLQHRHISATNKNAKPSRQIWQGREDEDMLREKQSSWSAKKDGATADYAGSEDAE